MRVTVFLLCLFAPVPPYRIPVPKSIVGEWKMHWRGMVFPTAFAKDGYYESGSWRGEWKQTGNTVTVIEFMKDSESPPITWTVTLEPGKLKGKIQPGDSEFLLEKP